MSGPNGHAQKDHAPTSGPPPAMLVAGVLQAPAERVKELVAALLFMPSPITSTADPFLAHVHSDFYEKARKYVEGGGLLYASVASDSAIPDMASLFGAPR